MEKGAAEESKVEIAQNMLKEGLDIELIAKLTGLRKEEAIILKRDE